MTKETTERINEKYPITLLRFDLVDDNDADRELAIDVLNFYGIHNINQFSDPDEFQAAVEKDPALNGHICVFDYDLKHPRLDGLSLTIMLLEKAKPKKFKPKIIMVSAFEDFDVVVDFLNAGGFKWVRKHGDFKKFKAEFVPALSAATTEVIEALEERALLDELDED